MVHTSQVAQAAPLSDPDRLDHVGIKAFVRVADAWAMKNSQAARLIEESSRTWTRMKSGDWNGKLTNDQRLRISGVIGLYKGLHLYFSDALADRWPVLPNDGPLFQGARPVDFMDSGGLFAIINTRKYVDALRGGV